MPITYIAYTRVSTERQGSEGVSLSEQKRLITEYAGQHHLHIQAWYEERTTAAKQGRPIFKRVMAELGAGQGEIGLLLHKIDRGARNLRDWADIGDAIDRGITVRFAHDDVDLHTRGGRLTADIQAVIAADYIRNLREETKKGIDGRLRQGLFPFPAPRGYVNCGAGRTKLPDPVQAALVVAAFERYATGTRSLSSLASELTDLGLTKGDQPLPPNALSKILHNPFYAGRLVVKGETYVGRHQPLITHDLFDEVQRVLSRRGARRRRRRHSFHYRLRLQCLTCNRHLVGELQKGRVYYRCGLCPGVSVREDRVSSADLSPNKPWSLKPQKSLTLQSYSKFDSSHGVCAGASQNRPKLNLAPLF